MKPFHCALLVVLSGLTVPCVAESAKDKIAAIHPTDKKPSPVGSNERNPYSVRDTSIHDEKLAIIKKLRQLEVTSRARLFGNFRLSLGGILIERGVLLPQLIPNQTQKLKVIDVTDSNFIIGWIDPKTHQLTGETESFNYQYEVEAFLLAR